MLVLSVVAVLSDGAFVVADVDVDCVGAVVDDAIVVAPVDCVTDNVDDIVSDVSNPLVVAEV